MKKNNFLFFLVFAGIVFFDFAKAIDTVATGFKVLIGNTAMIDAYSICKRITNNRSNDLFVPTATSNEWLQFRNNLPTNVIDNGLCNDSYTKLLLHFDNNFSDSSSSGHSISPTGAVISASQYRYGVTSGYFDGSGDYLYLSDSNDWDWDTGDFTIDTWVRFVSFPNTAWFYWQGIPGNSGDYQYMQYDTGTSRLNWGYVSGNVTKAAYSIPWTLSYNTWYHIAFVRNGSSGTFYINGVSQTTTVDTAFTGSLSGLTGNIWIGKHGYGDGLAGGGHLNGYLEEFRFSKGIARWTTNFTPP